VECHYRLVLHFHRAVLGLATAWTISGLSISLLLHAHPPGRRDWRHLVPCHAHLPGLFLLDVVPISLLGLAGAMYMSIRCWGRLGWWFLPAVALFYVAVNLLLFFTIKPTDIQLRVNLSYASLAIVVLTPVGLVLLRTRFRHAGWVVAAVISFVIAWFFRLVDRSIDIYLPMGSHWLWHTFGAFTTALIIEYFYLVEGEQAGTKLEAPV
jgi:hypothetical protein